MRNYNYTDEMRNERRQKSRSNGMARTEAIILYFLALGGSYTAQQMREGYVGRAAGYGFIWEALRKLESEGLVYRGRYQESWRTANHWNITGCGLLRAPTPNAETVAAIKELEAGGGQIYHGSAKEIFDQILAEPD